MTPFVEPFAPLLELSRELNRFAPGGPAPRSFVPAADVVVSDDDVMVVVDVPGLSVENLKVELFDDVLRIHGERAFPYPTGKGEDGRDWQRLERGFGTFERILRVPKGLDPEKISASMADGVLTLHLPKPEARKPRRIEIASASPPTIEGTESSDQRELAGSSS